MRKALEPSLLSMSPGRDDFIIMLVGDTEKEILLEFKDLLADLCSYRDYLCTNGQTRMRMPIKTSAR
jgi:hypothetical protein